LGNIISRGVKYGVWREYRSNRERVSRVECIECFLVIAQIYHLQGLERLLERLSEAYEECNKVWCI